MSSKLVLGCKSNCFKFSWHMLQEIQLMFLVPVSDFTVAATVVFLLDLSSVLFAAKLLVYLPFMSVALLACSLWCA